jgi:hypothetical protein
VSPEAVAIALEAVRSELVEAKQWHEAAQTNLETAEGLHDKAQAAMHEAGVRVLAVERTIDELEQLQPITVSYAGGLNDDGSPVFGAHEVWNEVQVPEVQGGAEIAADGHAAPESGE